MLYRNRKKFSGIQNRIGLIFSKAPLTPNQWTIASLGLAAGMFLLIFLNLLLPAFLLSLFVIFIDMVDGAVARATNRTTVFGAFLDTIIDRMIEFLFILGFYIIFNNIIALILLFCSMMITYIKAAAFEKGLIKLESKGGGLLEHTERLFIFSFIILISYFSLEIAFYVILITIFLLIITFFQRLLTLL